MFLTGPRPCAFHHKPVRAHQQNLWFYQLTSIIYQCKHWFYLAPPIHLVPGSTWRHLKVLPSATYPFNPWFYLATQKFYHPPNLNSKQVRLFNAGLARATLMMPKTGGPLQNGSQHIGWDLATQHWLAPGNKNGWHLLEQLIFPGLRGCLVKEPVDLQDVLAFDQEKCPTCVILVDTLGLLLLGNERAC